MNLQLLSDSNELLSLRCASGYDLLRENAELRKMANTCPVFDVWLKFTTLWYEYFIIYLSMIWLLYIYIYIYIMFIVIYTFCTLLGFYTFVICKAWTLGKVHQTTSDWSCTQLGKVVHRSLLQVCQAVDCTTSVKQYLSTMLFTQMTVWWQNLARYQLHVLMLYNGRDTDPSIGTSECSDMRHVTIQKRPKPLVCPRFSRIWRSMKHHETSWNIMKHHETSWNITKPKWHLDLSDPISFSGSPNFQGWHKRTALASAPFFRQLSQQFSTCRAISGPLRAAARVIFPLSCQVRRSHDANAGQTPSSLQGRCVSYGSSKWWKMVKDVAVYKSAHVSSENLLIDSHSAPNVPKLFHP